MSVALFASEMDPFIKTGGLADVIGSLPSALSLNIEHVDVFIPYYRNISQSNLPTEDLGIQFQLKIGKRIFSGKVFQLKQNGYTVYFIDNYHFFRIRSQLYVRKGKDYSDNLERFVFFNQGALTAIEEILTS